MSVETFFNSLPVPALSLPVPALTVVVVGILFVLTLRLIGTKIIILLIGAVMILAVLFKSCSDSTQKTIQAPADAINSTVAVTSLTTSNAAAVASLAASNAAAQSASSALACMMGLIVVLIVGALCVGGVLALRWWLANQDLQTEELKQSRASVPKVMRKVVTRNRNVSTGTIRKWMK